MADVADNRPKYRVKPRPIINVRPKNPPPPPKTPKPDQPMGTDAPKAAPPKVKINLSIRSGSTKTKPRSKFIDTPIVNHMWDESGVYSNGEKTWLLPCHNRFLTWIREEYGEFSMDTVRTDVSCESRSKSSRAFKYQRFMSEFLAPESPYRGILAFHFMGSGKTRTAVELFLEYMKRGIKCIFLSNASVQENFKNEAKLWGKQKGITDMEIEKWLLSPKGASLMVTMNAANTVQTLENLEKEIGFDGKLFIVDEVHNLMTMMVNGGKKGKEIYNLFLNAKNSKFLFLSGTPIVNTPYELGLMFNILHGYFPTQQKHDVRRQSVKRLEEKHTLFPSMHDDSQEGEDEFYRLYVDGRAFEFTNKRMFGNRVSGLVSYYRGASETLYPRVIGPENVKCPMSKHQFEVYKKYRLVEIKEEKSRNFGESSDNAFKQKSTFRVRTRQASNFGLPDDQKYLRPSKKDAILTQLKTAALPANFDELDAVYKLGIHDTLLEKTKKDFNDANTDGDRQQILQQALENSRKIRKAPDVRKVTKTDDKENIYNKMRQKAYDKALVNLALAISSDEFTQYVTANPVRATDSGSSDGLQKHSSKMYESIMRLEDLHGMSNGKGGSAFVYSQYRQFEGIGIYARALDANGYKRLNVSSGITTLDKMKTAGEENIKGRYIILSGEESRDERVAAVKLFNDPRNRYGDYIRVILGTAAVAEGIGFHCVRQVHILEPHWNKVRNDQVISRARRLCSHKDLEESERNFTVYQYYATMGFDEKEADLMASDLKDPTEKTTTDLYISGIAEDKDLVNKQVLQILKNNATDSYLNFHHNKSADEHDTVTLREAPVVDRSPVYWPIPHVDEYDDRYASTVQHTSVKIQEYHTRLRKLKGLSLVVKLDDQEQPVTSTITLQSLDRFGDLAGREIDNAIPVYNREIMTGILMYHIPKQPDLEHHIREVFAQNVKH